MRHLAFYTLLFFMHSISIGQSDSINNFCTSVIDSLKEKEIVDVFLIQQYTGFTSVGYGIIEQKETCTSKKDYIILWRTGDTTNYIFSNDCYYSKTYSSSDSIYTELLDLFLVSDFRYNVYPNDSSFSCPFIYEIHKIDKLSNTFSSFYTIGTHNASQPEKIFFKLIQVLNFLNQTIREKDFKTQKHRIEENWK